MFGRFGFNGVCELSRESELRLPGLGFRVSYSPLLPRLLSRVPPHYESIVTRVKP
jgi:hypothetical protein